MKCCQQCEGIERTFDAGVAEEELEDYRKNGPAKETKMLLNALKAQGVEGLTLLDIGGGVGAIQHDLLKAGVQSATDVDASSSYLAASRQEAQRLGYADRVNYQYGNFVDLAPNIEEADIVTLDRVLCCYHDMPALVKASSAKAKKFYAFVFPRDAWWLKGGVRMVNFFQWVRRDPMRFFIHPTSDVDTILRGNGLKKHTHRKTFLWQVLIYTR